MIMQRQGYNYREGDRRLLGQRDETESMPVADMRKDIRWDGVLLVRGAEQRAASNGSKYLDMTLSDRTGDINAKLWDGSTPPPEVGRPIRVRGQVVEYNGRLQFRIDRMRPLQDGEEVSVESLAPCAPENPESMLAEVQTAAASIGHGGLRALVGELLDQAGSALMFYPAAQKLHHAERSGLLHHTVSMLRLSKAFAELYPVLDGDLLTAGVIAHDLAKITELESDAYGMVREYTTEGLLMGHIVRGVVNIESAGKKAGTDPYTVLLLQHMMLAHHGEAEYGSPRKPMIPEAEALHIIDKADAHLFEITAAVRRLNPGTFSEKIWSLDRRLYRMESRAERTGECAE